MNACEHSLVFVCVSDSGVLLVGLANQFVRYAFDVDLRAQSDFLCRAHVAATHLLIDYSIWALVLISAQRALVIVAPRLFERLFSRSSLAISLTALVYVLLAKNLLLCMHFRTKVFYTPHIGLRRTCLADKGADRLLQVCCAYDCTQVCVVYTTQPGVCRVRGYEYEYICAAACSLCHPACTPDGDALTNALFPYEIKSCMSKSVIQY